MEKGGRWHASANKSIPVPLQMVDTEHRKVAEVAAEYGCNPVNFYALLGKLRREASRSVETAGASSGEVEERSPPGVEARPSPDALAPAAMAGGPDLFAPGSRAGEAPAREEEGSWLRAPPDENVVSTRQAAAPHERPAPPLASVPRQEPPARDPPMPRSVTQLPAPVPARKGGGLGAGLAKPGMALMMRTADGEESLTPFRSLDDLLSAAKPILRAAASSPDAVWFSYKRSTWPRWTATQPDRARPVRTKAE